MSLTLSSRTCFGIQFWSYQRIAVHGYEILYRSNMGWQYVGIRESPWTGALQGRLSLHVILTMLLVRIPVPRVKGTWGESSVPIFALIFSWASERLDNALSRLLFSANGSLFLNGQRITTITAISGSSFFSAQRILDRDAETSSWRIVRFSERSDLHTFILKPLTSLSIFLILFKNGSSQRSADPWF